MVVRGGPRIGTRVRQRRSLARLQRPCEERGFGGRGWRAARLPLPSSRGQRLTCRPALGALTRAACRPKGRGCRALATRPQGGANTLRPAHRDKKRISSQEALRAQRGRSHAAMPHTARVGGFKAPTARERARAWSGARHGARQRVAKANEGRGQSPHFSARPIAALEESPATLGPTPRLQSPQGMRQAGEGRPRGAAAVVGAAAGRMCAAEARGAPR